MRSRSAVGPQSDGIGDERARLASLAWPVSLGGLGVLAMGLVDAITVGRLGPEALAAVGAGNAWTSAGLIVGLGAAAGLDPFYTQAFGENAPKRAGAAFLRGLLLLGLLSVPISATLLCAEAGLELLAQPPSISPVAGRYAAIVAASVPAIFAFAALKQLLQGDGQMRAAMWVIAAGNLLNLVADVLLVHGGLGVPALGVDGAAISTVIVRWAMLLALLALGREQLRRCWPSLGLRGLLDRARLRELCRTALPVGLHWGAELWAFNATSFLAGTLGATALAAHTVTMSIASTAFMLPLGLGAAAATRVGKLRGAGRGWSASAWTAVGLGALVALLLSAAFIGFPAALGRLYTNSPSVLALVSLTLPVVGLYQVADGMQVAAAGALRGVGETRAPAAMTLLGYWVIGLPAGAALALGLDLGLQGLWMGLGVGVLAMTTGILLRLRRLAPLPLPAASELLARLRAARMWQHGRARRAA